MFLYCHTTSLQCCAHAFPLRNADISNRGSWLQIGEARSPDCIHNGGRLAEPLTSGPTLLMFVDVGWYRLIWVVNRRSAQDGESNGDEFRINHPFPDTANESYQVCDLDHDIPLMINTIYYGLNPYILMYESAGCENQSCFDARRAGTALKLKGNLLRWIRPRAMPKPLQRKFSKDFLILVRVWSEAAYSSIYTLVVFTMAHSSCFQSGQDLFNVSLFHDWSLLQQGFLKSPQEPTRSDKIQQDPTSFSISLHGQVSIHFRTLGAETTQISCFSEDCKAWSFPVHQSVCERAIW